MEARGDRTLTTYIRVLATMLAVAWCCFAMAAPIQVTRVDSLERVFPDLEPVVAAFAEPISVPRGGTVDFQFGVRSAEAAAAAIGVAEIKGPGGCVLDAAGVRAYHVLAVPVEANNNGGSKTAAGVIPKESWHSSFVRMAPFEVAEVLIETGEFALKADRTESVLVSVDVPGDAAPGLYRGALEVSADGETAKAEFALRVHETVLPEQYAIHSTHWFFHEPKNLTNGELPEWYSERHWKLIENSARTMREFGQDTLLTPTVDYEHALIEVIREADGSYSFDYTRFDRWAEMCFGMGYRLLAGHHISMMPYTWIYGGVYYTDRETGERRVLAKEGKDNEVWLAFIPEFYKSLYGHLSEKGWLDRYVQHQLDEPRNDGLYEKLAQMARENMPGVRTIDAINSRPDVFSPLVDIQVFAMTILAGRRELAEKRREAGQISWLYHCCSPYPPYPNRHLDERLSDSRLYPWLGYLLEADGYLFWGGNVFRGADPYKTSVGPVPNGSQNPGHPPGDNWMFYPSEDGLIGSMRMVAFREGLIDLTLLRMLAEKDKAAADAVMAKIARTAKDYEKTAAPFHGARREILEALEG